MKKNEITLFNRDGIDVFKYQEYLNTKRPNFTYNQIKSIFFNINKYFDWQDYKYFQKYCFDFTKEWINKNELYTEQYIERLETILKKLNLYRLLSSAEIEYINHFKSVVFAKKRNLKKLIVDFPLIKNETDSFIYEEIVYYHFDKCILYKHSNQNDNTKEINVYISDIRIICSDDLEIHSFYLDEIKSYKINKNLFEISYKNNVYYIKPMDVYEFFVSFERIVELKN